MLLLPRSSYPKAPTYSLSKIYSVAEKGSSSSCICLHLVIISVLIHTHWAHPSDLLCTLIHCHLWGWSSVDYIPFQLLRQCSLASYIIRIWSYLRWWIKIRLLLKVILVISRFETGCPGLLLRWWNITTDVTWERKGLFLLCYHITVHHWW